MTTRTYRALLLVLTLFVCNAAAQAPPEPANLGALPDQVADSPITQGLWIWSDTVFATSDQRTRLLDFCVQYQFNHLALAVYFEDARAAALRLRHEEGLSELIQSAAARGITVGALRGARKMAFAENHAQTLRELRAILDYNERHPQGRFVDIHYDIEPYGTDEWRAGGEARRTVQIDYLDFFHAARDLLSSRKSSMTLSADTPYWFDKGVFVLDYGGEVKHFSEHIQDVTDFITLMSYNRDPVRVLEQVAGEADYAHKIGKHVNAGMEVGYVRGEEHFISFHWVPTFRFWQARYLIETDAVARRGLGGVYVHFYRALYDKLNGEPPWEPRR